jgi:hypothetical protein
MRRCGENLVTPVWFNCLTGFSHLLLIGNASTNFLIYCSLRSTGGSWNGSDLIPVEDLAAYM